MNQKQRIIQLLHQVPDEGLDELEETMREIIEFHKERADYAPRISTQPKSFPVKITIVERVDHPIREWGWDE